MIVTHLINGATQETLTSTLGTSATKVFTTSKERQAVHITNLDASNTLLIKWASKGAVAPTISTSNYYVQVPTYTINPGGNYVDLQFGESVDIYWAGSAANTDAIAVEMF